MPSDTMRNRWFQPGEGIAREVITADIQRYLGRDALVRPGSHEGIEGYWITAYRNLTSEMIQDLRQDSLRWRHEQQGHSQRGSGGQGSRHAYKNAAPTYLDSKTHESRQYYGPTVTPAQTESRYDAPPAQRGYPSDSVRTSAGYGAHGHPGYDMQPAEYEVQAGYPGYPSQTSAGYQDPSLLQSPSSVYTHSSSSAQSGYSNASGASGLAVAGMYNQGPSAGGYGAMQDLPQYTTSSTPQVYGQAQLPRNVAGGYDGYPPSVDPRTTSDPYYQTGQVQSSASYGYPNVPASSGRETVYPGAGMEPTGSPSVAIATDTYTDEYGRPFQSPPNASSSSRKRGHEGSGSSGTHRRR